MQDKLFNMLINEDEITWKSIIMDLVKTEQIDPWNIDITLLTKKYIETINKLEEHNFFISGKVLLASAILLKLKSNKLLTQYLADFDNLLFPPEPIDELDDEENFYKNYKAPKLLVKTPQARKRKVNLNDLMSALQKALDVDNKRRIRKSYEVPIREFKLPKNKFNITDLIKNIYNKIQNLFNKKEKITFTELVNSDKKEHKINTFIPLLHLANQEKVHIHQEIPFGEIDITKPLSDNESQPVMHDTPKKEENEK